VATGTPIAAPSANPFGYVSPTTAAHVAERLGHAIDLILDGGPCRVGVESTILSLATEPPVVLRPGGVSREELEHTLGRALALASAPGRPLAPGQLPQHYATTTTLRILDGPPVALPGARVGLIAFSSRSAEQLTGFAAIEVLAPDGSLATAATNLFAALRRLDALRLDLILAERCPEHGLGLAIMDRLRRAAATSPAARP
jgi:L-threonylcarbamoyladenylate synthase